MHNCCITETNTEERNSMQVWLQRTVGCIALSSLVFFGANLWGCVGWVGGLFIGSVQGVVLVRVFAFAMYRVGLAGPQHNWVLCVETWNNLELAIFTGTRRATISLSESRHWKFDQNNALRIFCTWV